jgi:hypothetical protein
LDALIEKQGDRLPGHFVVVDLNKYRFRPLIFKQLLPATQIVILDENTGFQSFINDVISSIVII